MKAASLAICFALAAVAAHAQEKKDLTPQQQLMGTCNKEASGKTGDERKKFMSTCLSDGKKRQQERMKACSSENKGKKGDEYKKAQAECLRK